MNINLGIGDVILTGKFQNKKIKITSIETNDLGQPTYNGGRPVLKFRIQKLIPVKESKQMNTADKLIQQVLKESKEVFDPKKYIGKDVMYKSTKHDWVVGKLVDVYNNTAVLNNLRTKKGNQQLTGTFGSRSRNIGVKELYPLSHTEGLVDQTPEFNKDKEYTFFPGTISENKVVFDVIKVEQLLKQGWGKRMDNLDVDKRGASWGTGDRGPRTDHGGPPDGDGWLPQSKVEQLRQTYEKKYAPEIKRIKDLFKKNNTQLQSIYVDYGEKGHVSILVDF